MRKSGWFGNFAFFSSRSSTVPRSRPVTVSIAPPGSLLGRSWWCVITPSISTSGTTPSATAMTTRFIGASVPR